MSLEDDRGGVLELLGLSRSSGVDLAGGNGLDVTYSLPYAMKLVFDGGGRAAGLQEGMLLRVLGRKLDSKLASFSSFILKTAVSPNGTTVIQPHSRINRITLATRLVVFTAWSVQIIHRYTAVCLPIDLLLIDTLSFA